MKVVRSFLKAGVPLSKVSLFREILEETGYRLTDRRHLFDMIPFILKEEEAVIKNAIEGQHLGMELLRFVSDFWTIEQCVVRVQSVSKSMKGEEIACELIHVLSSTYSIKADKIVAAMHDHASVNGVAMRTMKIVYPSLLDVGCFSHALDRVGDHFNTPNLSEFWNSWIALFSHSAKAKMLWKEQTGKAMKTYSSTRWWSKWEVIHQLLIQFGDIQPFVCASDLESKSKQKLVTFLQNINKKSLLMVEIASIVDWGEPFVKGT